MKLVLTSALLLLSASAVLSQNKFPAHYWSINGFRNPSIGVEYHHYQVSVHGGFYTTAFKAGTYTNFVRTGVTWWFAATGNKEIPSSFYAGVSYLHGLNQQYKYKSALGVEAGYRWMVWKGLNLRLGGIAVAAKGQSLKFNPTPGISYSFQF